MRCWVMALALATLLAGTIGPSELALPARAQEPVLDGRIVYAAHAPGQQHGRIEVVEGAGEVRVLVDREGDALWPRLSPDGRRVVFQARDGDGDWELFVMDIGGGVAEQITHNDVNDGYPSWGPDGTIIAAQGQVGGNPDVVIHDPATGTLARLTDHPGIDTQPALSPDGSQVVFVSDRAGARDVWLMDLDGGNLRNLTPDGASDVEPSWSPDGRTIAYSSDVTGDYEVWVTDPAGAEQRNLTQHPASDGVAAWSPDGSWIAFNSDRLGDGDRDIFAAPVDELVDPYLLVATTADEFVPSWGPVPPLDVVRLFGPDRIETAIAIAEHAWTAPVAAVVLARSDAFPDALAGGALAVQEGGPLLLTGRDALHPSTSAALQRLMPGPVQGREPVVYLLGGTAALGPQVEADVAALGFQTVRLAGPTRFDTAVAIARLGVAPGAVFLADGGVFQPALLAGAAAAADGGVLVLTASDQMPGPTAEYLADRAGASRQVAVGDAAIAAAPTLEAIDGADPWILSVNVARWTHGSGPRTVALASGVNFPDGLTGGAHARWFDAPLLLTDADTLPAEVASYLEGLGAVERLLVYGGPAAVDDAVIDAAASALLR